jgi:hypothetical protein
LCLGRNKPTFTSQINLYFMDDISTQAKQLSDELYELTLRAKRIAYKNKPPHLPKNLTISTLSGFVKRYSSWKRGLQILEQELERGTIKTQTNLLKNFTTK